MKKLLGGLVAAVAMVMASWAGAGAAQAYPEVPPETPPQVQSGPPPPSTTTSTASALPATGGPNGLLLGGAVGLLVAGGTVFTWARRRETN